MESLPEQSPESHMPILTVVPFEHVEASGNQVESINLSELGSGDRIVFETMSENEYMIRKNDRNQLRVADREGKLPHGSAITIAKEILNRGETVLFIIAKDASGDAGHPHIYTTSRITALRLITSFEAFNRSV